MRTPIRCTTSAHRPSRLALLLLVALVALVALASPASAHASLVGSSPGDGERLAEAPDRVTLDFSEGVTADLGGVRVLDAGGTRVDLGAVEQPSDSQLVVRLAGGLAAGTYLVSYRVLSADGHPVDGAVVFAVGDVIDEASVADLQVGDDGLAEVVGLAARLFVYGGALLVAGLVAFVGFVHDGAPDGRRLVVLARGAAVAAAVGALLLVLSQAALATGLDLGAATDPDVLRSVLRRGGLGWSVALLLTGLAAAAALVDTKGSPARRAVAVGAGLVAVASLALFGHSTTATPQPAILVADAVHVGVAALWFGGLVGLALTLVPRARAARAATSVERVTAPVGGGGSPATDHGPAADPAGGDAMDSVGIVLRFSTSAALAVFVLWLSGGALAWSLVGSVDALVEDGFGRVLLVKLALVGAVVVLAAWNRYRLIPSILQAEADADEVAPDDPGAATGPPRADEPPGVEAAPDLERARWAALARTVRLEAVLLALVVVVTSVLVQLTPPAQATPGDGPVTTDLAVTDQIDLNVTVVPATTGRNTVHLSYTDATSHRPVDPVQDVTVELALPSLDVGPIVETPPKAGPGHYILVTDAMAVEGTWQVTVRSRLDRFTEERSTARVPVVDD